MKALISRGAGVNAKERQDQTAIMWAAADGHAAVVEVLIEAGADFRTPLESGFTPMFFAVREGRTNVVRTLLKAGVDVNDTTEPRKTSGHVPPKGTSPLLLAVDNGHFDLALTLLKAGADPNDQRSGTTALHTMTWVRKPSRGDGFGEIAPMGSGNLSSIQFVRELVAHGANVNVQLEKGGGSVKKIGATPFLLAAKNADVPLMRLLLELGADPLLPNVDQCTPLMVAAGVGCRNPTQEAGTEPEALEAVRLLLGLGASINQVDKNGETAMHGAAYKNLPKMVRLLAVSGAKIDVWNRKNDRGWTPLLIAQGYRPGNFKPSHETIDVIKQVMLAEGISPPKDPPTYVGGYP